MGIDYLTCNWCYDNFPDCGHMVICNCGNIWCSDDCAKEDKIIYYECPRSCKKCEQQECIGEDKCHDVNHCNDCEYLKFCENKDGNPKTCKYCRHEDIEDSELLNFVLKTVNLTREQAIKLYNKNEVK